MVQWTLPDSLELPGSQSDLSDPGVLGIRGRPTIKQWFVYQVSSQGQPQFLENLTSRAGSQGRNCHPPSLSPIAERKLLICHAKMSSLSWIARLETGLALNKIPDTLSDFSGHEYMVRKGISLQTPSSWFIQWSLPQASVSFPGLKPGLLWDRSNKLISGCCLPVCSMSLNICSVIQSPAKMGNSCQTAGPGCSHDC